MHFLHLLSSNCDLVVLLVLSGSDTVLCVVTTMEGKETEGEKEGKCHVFILFNTHIRVSAL